MLEETRLRLSGVGVSTLTTGLLKRGLRNQFLPGIAPVRGGLPNMVGPAFTLRFIPAREDVDTFEAIRRPGSVLRRAIEECPPGCVLIADTGGERRAGTAGDLMVRRLKVRGCAGIVTDGGFRDVEGVRAVEFPAYQSQTASGAPAIGLHAVDLDQPIRCAGVAIYPGDILVGDNEGVIVLPSAMADELSIEAAAATAYEAFAEAKVADGRPVHEVFPPTEASQKEFALWKATQPPD